MSRNKSNAVPQIKYDFNRVTDRRREPRQEAYEVMFRDTSPSDRLLLTYSGRPNGRN